MQNQMFSADQEETVNVKSRPRYGTGRLPSESVIQQQKIPHSADLMKELSICLDHRRQRTSVRHSDVSPNVSESAVLYSSQPSYINQPLYLQIDSSDDDGDYVKPSREITVDRDDDDDDDSSDFDTLGRPRHEYINIRTRRD